MNIIDIAKGEDGLTIISGNRDGVMALASQLREIAERDDKLSAPKNRTYGIHTLVGPDGKETRIAVWLPW